MFRAVAMLVPPLAGLDTVRQRIDDMDPYAPKIDIRKADIKKASDGWNISDDSLRCVPEHFVLERTAKFVNHCPASVVASRICNCLRNRSIEAIFDCIKAKAKCFSQNFVEFRVRLFAGKGEYGDGVIVEVQRRSGSAVYFRDECHAIFDAAEGGCDESPEVKRPECHLDALKELTVESAAKSLELTLDLLKKDRLDANLLGLQSLVLLTDAVKSGVDTALVASKSIVLHDDQSELRDIIASLIRTGVMNQDEDEALKELEIFYQLRTNAFIALSNALDVCAKDGCLSQAIVDQQWYINFLVPCLIKELSKAQDTPHIALLSTKCLNSLVECSGFARSRALDVGALDALAHAHEFGKARYANLATETDRGVHILECAC